MRCAFIDRGSIAEIDFRWNVRKINNGGGIAQGAKQAASEKKQDAILAVKK